MSSLNKTLQPFKEWTYFIAESKASNRTNVYASPNINVTLPCSIDYYDEASWFGPCFNDTGKCHARQVTYYDGLIHHPSISSLIHFKNYSSNQRVQYNLHIISEFSFKNNGTYICTGFRNKSIQTKTYEVLMKGKHLSTSQHKIQILPIVK